VRRRGVACVAAALAIGATLWPPAPAIAAPAKAECLPAAERIDDRVPWAQQRLALDRAWELSRGGGVTVAVVDTGVDARTPQLSGRVLRGHDMLVSGGAGNTDCFGHGTFVAGIIGAAPLTGAGFVGVAPDVRILPVRATDGQDGTAEAFARGIVAAVDSGAKVINVSASTTSEDPRLVEAVRYAESRDVVVVAAVANGSASPDSASPTVYPAALPTVLAVAAIDATGQRASFSQPGHYIDLAAPGADVTSVGPDGPGHLRGSGTSYAAPFVAGVAALVRAYRPGLTAAQVRHRLQVTADRPARVPDAGVGWGVVNPLAALATELPEEGAASGAHAARPSAQPAAPPVVRHNGRLLVLLGAGATLAVIGLAGLLAVLGPAGHRRRWRPARTLRVHPDREPWP